MKDIQLSVLFKTREKSFYLKAVVYKPIKSIMAVTSDSLIWQKISVFWEPFPHHSEMKDAENYACTEMVIF